jgi:hypothetical protein
MAFKDKQTRKERLSSIVSGDVRGRNRAGPSMIRLNSVATMPRYGMPVSGLRGRTPKDQSRIPEGTIDIRGYFGDEGTGVRKPTARMPAPAVKKAPAAKKAVPIRTTVDMRTTPAKAKAPTRMAVNPRTGSTLGFTTGKTTGSTSFKPGVAAKTRVSPAQQMARNAFNKGGVAGPSRSGGGRSAGPSRSTSAPSRGDVGAGRRGGGR